MEGGSPTLIWERWTLPMLAAQRRYWGDHPRLSQIAASYFKIPHKYTPPDASDQKPAHPFQWDALDQ